MTSKKQTRDYGPITDADAELGAAVSDETDDPKLPKLCSFCPFDAFPWLMLLCICWLTFGSYWIFDTPGAIFKQLEEWFGPENYSKSKNLNLYSIYSWPNTVLAFFGGFIVDRVTGVRMGALLFCSMIATGQLVFALGIESKAYWTCFVGRLIFGLGGESLTVAQNTYTVRWFDGPRKAMAFGLVVAFARIGSSVNFVVTPMLARSGVPTAVWFGMGACGLSLFACICAALIDWYGQPRVDAMLEAKRAKGEKVDHAPVSLAQVKDFPLSAWLLFLICVFFYICVLTFYTVASDIMQKTGNKYHEDTATLFLSIPNFVSIVASPSFGFIVDRKGYALNWILTASFMMVAAHFAFFSLAMEWISWSPIPIMLWLGVAYAMGASAMWPTLSVVVDERMVATGYGTMTAVQNIGLAVFPLIIGQLQDASSINGTKLEYTLPCFIFIGCAGVSILLTFILLGVDRRRHQGRMNASAARRVQLKEEAEAAGKAALLSADHSEMPSPLDIQVRN